MPDGAGAALSALLHGDAERVGDGLELVVANFEVAKPRERQGAAETPVGDLGSGKSGALGQRRHGELRVVGDEWEIPDELGDLGDDLIERWGP